MKKLDFFSFFMRLKVISGGKESGAFTNQRNKKNYFQCSGNSRLTIPFFKVIVDTVFL